MLFHRSDGLVQEVQVNELERDAKITELEDLERDATRRIGELREEHSQARFLEGTLLPTGDRDDVCQSTLNSIQKEISDMEHKRECCRREIARLKKAKEAGQCPTI
jgi:chromosome segregation ATPase